MVGQEFVGVIKGVGLIFFNEPKVGGNIFLRIKERGLEFILNFLFIVRVLFFQWRGPDFFPKAKGGTKIFPRRQRGPEFFLCMQRRGPERIGDRACFIY